MELFVVFVAESFLKKCENTKKMKYDEHHQFHHISSCFIIFHLFGIFAIFSKNAKSFSKIRLQLFWFSLFFFFIMILLCCQFCCDYVFNLVAGFICVIKNTFKT